jgi:hypothetical protein
MVVCVVRSSTKGGNMFTHKERANARASLARLGMTADECNRVARDVARLQTAAENACNAELTPRQLALQACAKERVRQALGAVGAKVRVDGDPRGYVVKIHHPALKANTWGGDSEGHALGGAA